ncbi:hypothetical protein [Rufibacter sp. LB8]|uniref:hypothetical protein n=1 Tax=Rufibacter sp. LB8 TaxID=2777781 RepID=UPI00178C74C5|nr:hypothetical protein [Rufibacter sp. LB8]
MKARVLPFLLVLLFWGEMAAGQSKVIYDQQRTENFTLRSSENPDLRQMAVELERTLRSQQMALLVAAEWQERIARDGHQLKLEVSVKNVQVKERVFYQEFDFSQELTPTVVGGKVQLLGPEGKVLQTYDLGNKTLGKNGAAMVLQATFADTSAFAGFKLKVVESRLGFSTANRSAVKERVELVRRYYAADARLSLLARDLQTVNPNDLDRLAQHSERLRAMEAELSGLLSQHLTQELELNQRDPVQLRRRVRELDDRFKGRRVALDQMWARLPEIYYNRGLEMAVNGNARAGREFFERSLQANPAFAPSHLQLARLDLQAGYVKESALRTKDLLNRMQVDPETHRYAQELALDIQNTYVRHGEQLNNQGKFEQALAQFEQARDFCRGISSLRCRPELWERGMTFAVNGIYDDLLQDGKSALNQRNLAQAEKLAKQAQLYARNNKASIDSDAAAQNLMLDVQEQVYLSLMASGRKTLQAQKYAEALASFEKAKSVALDYKLTEQPEANTLVKQAAKPVILAQIADGQQEASANRLSKARTIANQVNSLQIKYNLVSDKELDAGFRALSQRIFSQECANAQASYDQLYQKALVFSNGKEFAKAAQELERAIAAAKENAGCAIPSATAEVELIRIDAPAHYQEQLQKVNNLVNQNKMAEAVQLYLQAGAEFEEDNVASFGLANESLVALALRHDNKGFIAEIARHLSANGNSVDAISLVRRLVALKYTKYNLNQLQEKIAEQLAIKDAQANPKADYKALANSYTGGAKELKTLNKAYQKKFKKLT